MSKKDREESKIYDFECHSKSYNILLVEDSKFFSKSLRKMLENDGHTVMQAFSLKEAYEHIEVSKFDYILLDIILPDGEGDEFVDALPKKMRSKVIVLTSDEDMQRRDYLFSLGILDYFSKKSSLPLILNDIKNIICDMEYNHFVNILAIDDSDFAIKMLRNILKPRGYNLFEAKSGKEGLSILDKEDIHLVLLDYEMPTTSGTQTLEKIKNDKRFLDIPVLMVSAHQEKDIVTKVLKLGAIDFIKKPFINEELVLKCNFHTRNYLNLEKILYRERELKKTLKEIKNAQEQKSIFLANMSHEIRTPLNSILGFVELLYEDENNKTKIEYLNTIKKSGELLLNIINDILDFSKIESGKLDINLEVFNLKEFLHLIISLHQPLMKSKNITFSTCIDDSLSKYFKSDFLRIKQIIINFLSNAIKFTPKNGEITFEIKKSCKPNFIEFSVKDTGIGIDPANHKKVFELFKQAKTDTAKNFGGTGLGLSISKKLAELLGGEVGLESELGKGSRFYLLLPVASIKDDDIKHLDSKKDINLKKNSAKLDGHFLVAEDNEANQLFVSIILKKLGATFDIASDGIKAVELFERNNYSAILMDENMPNMDGIKATKKILEIEKKRGLKHTPIIALTANALSGDRERLLEAGMDEYLSKPIDKNRLIDILGKIIKNKKKVGK